MWISIWNWQSLTDIDHKEIRNKSLVLRGGSVTDQIVVAISRHTIRLWDAGNMTAWYNSTTGKEIRYACLQPFSVSVREDLKSRWWSSQRLSSGKRNTEWKHVKHWLAMEKDCQSWSRVTCSVVQAFSAFLPSLVILRIGSFRQKRIFSEGGLCSQYERLSTYTPNMPEKVPTF